MDINDVSSEINRASQNRRSDDSRSGRASATSEASGATQDSFESSGRLGEVKAFIDSLLQIPEIRSDVVEEARAKLLSGAFDTPEAAAEAAEGFLTEGSSS